MGQKTIDFYFFSGTGNTLLAVEEMKKVFINNNYIVNIFSIIKSNPSNINTKNIIGLAFPVAMQSTFPFVWEFIKKLPKVNKTKIFMVDTMHSFSGAIVGPLKKVLKKKGYETIGAKEIIMVRNLYTSKKNKIINAKKIEKGLKKAEEYANDIIQNKSRWPRIPVLSDLFYFLVSRKILWKLLSKIGLQYKIDKTQCTKCRLCVKLCPVKNITFKDYPVFDKKCQQCLRCIMFCPTYAIYLPKVKYLKYKAVDVKKILKYE
jgi:ferredoxin